MGIIDIEKCDGRARRVAIIGTDGFDRSDETVEINCFSWSRVMNIPNPSDNDVIIMNLTSLTNSSAVRWFDFFNKFSELTTVQVLANDGLIVIIGDPVFWTQESSFFTDPSEGGIGLPFLSWTGIEFDWDKRHGETKILTDLGPSKKPYISYIEKISQWDYCLRDHKFSNKLYDIAKSVLFKTGRLTDPIFELEKICENRYGGHIVFAIRLFISETRYDGAGDWSSKNKNEGRIIFLPQIDVPEEELLAIVLTDILGIQVVVPEPSWASAIVAPGQPDIDTRITQIDHEIATLEVELKDAEENRKRVRRCVHLLYKLGTELEDAVRDILRSLGSTIEPPVERDKEDGWLKVEIGGEIFEGVLEIKGTRKDQFSVYGLRQVMEWKSRGVANRKKKYKGIFVGNRGAGKDISNRREPFNKGWTDTAELDEIVVLDTQDLYKLYCRSCEGNLDKDQFWKVLFGTNGVFSLDDFDHPTASIVKKI